MAEKHHLQQQQQAQGYPLAPATGMPRSDEEHAANYRSQEETKKKNRKKCLAYIAAFAVIQTIVIVAIVLVFVRVKTPKVRLQDVAIANNGASVRFTAQVAVRNRNFGRYKFDSSLATISSGGSTVGQFTIQDARAGVRSTKRIYVVADLNSANTSGSLSLNVKARVRGEVEVLKVFERKKTATMRCTMTIDVPRNVVQDLRCD